MGEGEKSCKTDVMAEEGSGRLLRLMLCVLYMGLEIRCYESWNSV